MELDADNLEFNNAIQLVEFTDNLIYLTGKAGTGKTTFLKYIKEISKKQIVVVAPTGVAATNAGGMTIHSLFGIPLTPFIPEDDRLKSDTILTTLKLNPFKKAILKHVELLIIDEVSMVRVDVLDVIDKALRTIKKQYNCAFGGTQILLIGDAFQLSPIAKDDEWQILSQFYETPFFFSAKVFKEITPLYIELKKIYRQKEQSFIDILNRVRTNNVTDSDINRINSRYSEDTNLDGYITLTTHNNTANSINECKLKALPSELRVYEATIVGDFPDNILPAEKFLQCKIGAQVMLVKNDKQAPMRYYNGKIATIIALDDDYITVRFNDGVVTQIAPEKWDNIKYKYEPHTKRITTEEAGAFIQFPIKLAWAITIHKSQGLTLDKVIIDAGNAFTSGQVYVALSRCTTLGGIVLRTKISRSAIMVDKKVLDFAKLETPAEIINQKLSKLKFDTQIEKHNYASQTTEPTTIKKELVWQNTQCEQEISKLKQYNMELNAIISSLETNVTYYAKENKRMQKLLEEKEEQLSNCDVMRNEINTLRALLSNNEQSIIRLTQQIKQSNEELMRSKQESEHYQQLSDVYLNRSQKAITWCVAFAIGWIISLII